jgi:hypothetical protein
MGINPAPGRLIGKSLDIGIVQFFWIFLQVDCVPSLYNGSTTPAGPVRRIASGLPDAQLRHPGQKT